MNDYIQLLVFRCMHHMPPPARWYPGQLPMLPISKSTTANNDFSVHPSARLLPPTQTLACLSPALNLLVCFLPWLFLGQTCPLCISLQKLLLFNYVSAFESASLKHWRMTQLWMQNYAKPHNKMRYFGDFLKN